MTFQRAFGCGIFDGNSILCCEFLRALLVAVYIILGFTCLISEIPKNLAFEMSL